MRLMNLSAEKTIYHPSELDDDGKPKKGATAWKIRCLTNSEANALKDSLLDFGKTSVTPAKGGNAKVDMNMSISMSKRDVNRVRMGVCGWEGLQDHEGKEMPFAQEDFSVGNGSFKGIPHAIMEAMPNDLFTWLNEEIKQTSGMSDEEGNV